MTMTKNEAMEWAEREAAMMVSPPAAWAEDVRPDAAIGKGLDLGLMTAAWHLVRDVYVAAAATDDAAADAREADADDADDAEDAREMVVDAADAEDAARRAMRDWLSEE